MSEEKFILPREVRKATAINPAVQMIYSVIKAGKTTICAQLPNSLLIEIGPEKADFVDAMTINVKSPNEFEDICKQIIAEGCPYDYVVFDSVTILDDWSEIVGTMDYMGKSQGKNFNKDLATGARFSPKDPRFETVHSFREGYQYSRNKMNDWYNLMARTAKHVILLAHVKDKYIETKTGDSVEALDINLTGKVKNNYCIRVDAVGHFYRKGSQGFIKYDNENSVVCGGRCNHLTGDILISQKNEDKTITTFWDRIYLK